MKDFEVLPHTADIKLRIYGKTKKELFINALNAMFQSISPIAKGCEVKDGRIKCSQLIEQHVIEVHSTQLDLLLVDFLSEALYLSDIHNQAYFDAHIDKLTDDYIKATIYGVVVDRFDVVEIKAVTYHDLVVKQVNGIWQAELVFDI